MCGIAGILRPSLPPERARERVRAMTSRLAHRGPDQQGYASVGPIHLGHARLSIIDIAGGIQPMANEDGTIWLVFNGEIFNYLELRDDLAGRGHRFRTQSDTEVIIHLYEEHGLEFLREMNGQFAIAIWDAREERLVLARDRFGICPLHYVRRGDEIAFASEMKAFLADPDLRFEIDPEALAQVFTFWTVLPPRTIFAGIEALPAGCMLVADRTGVRLSRHWDLRFPEAGEADGRRARDFEDEIRETLLDSTRLRLRADVPVGAYLSGGLDSSIVATSV
ncbi:MAG: asparagine synthase (glutamine-hydrolyzing), partial [Planctomycetes bacterium]|nr:asparagine synthase (glutamine-hydrolyzing) [Planctomycetota bacterium]